jgi:DNA-binding GntR family transcriptional regulator
MDVFYILRSFYPFKHADIHTYIEDHENILSAVHSGDSQWARQLLLKHLHAGFDNLMKRYSAKSPSIRAASDPGDAK